MKAVVVLLASFVLVGFACQGVVDDPILGHIEGGFDGCEGYAEADSAGSAAEGAINVCNEETSE